MNSLEPVEAPQAEDGMRSAKPGTVQTTESGRLLPDPLDQIRYAELEVARQIAVARKTIESARATVEAQAADLKREAQEAGRRESQSQYDTVIAEANSEAETFLAQVRQQADDLRCRGNARMDVAVRRAVSLVSGEAGEAGEA
jgi:nucleotide-binding universal stress UspA family protein